MPLRLRLPSSLLLVVALLFSVLFASASASAQGVSGLDKRSCVRAGNHLTDLPAFEALSGRPVDCVLIYNDASPDWAGWENPWLTRGGDPNLNWGKWAAAQPGRRLIITQNLFPSEVNNTNWRDAGARGDFDDHARALARNLIAAGQSNAVIRLGHEANGTWYPDNVGNSASDYQQWARFWRHMVLAMKSVPGGHFVFDWCVNAAVRNIPLASYYPGDDVVDIVGVDAYDAGSGPAGAARWATTVNRGGALGDVLAFAKAHGKPLSIPEWGVAPSSVGGSGGDNAAYVNGIAKVVRDNDVAYQAYFYAYEFATQLSGGPASLAAYRQHFGRDGDSLDGSSATPDDAPDATTDAAPTTANRSASTTPAIAVTTVTPRSPATPVKAPAAPAAATPAAPATPAAVALQSKRMATALATATAVRVRALKTRSRTVARVRITPTLAGLACVSILPATSKPVTMSCGGRTIRLRSGIARVATTKARTSMAQARVKTKRATLRIPVAARSKRARARKLTIVAVFLPSADASALGLASLGVRPAS